MSNHVRLQKIETISNRPFLSKIRFSRPAVAKNGSYAQRRKENLALHFWIWLLDRAGVADEDDACSDVCLAGTSSRICARLVGTHNLHWFHHHVCRGDRGEIELCERRDLRGERRG